MVKVFNKNKIVTFEEIDNLHGSIMEKLEHFEVDGIHYHADIGLMIT